MMMMMMMMMIIIMMIMRCFQVFIAIQKAYETLSDDRKRRGYDSELDFSDAIPSGREKGDFFEVRGLPVGLGCSKC
jgi:hypothetical protein